MKHLFLSIFLIIVTTSCSAPSARIYSIYIPHEEIRYEKNNDLTLAVDVSGPKYLTQPFIAVRSSKYELTLLNYSKWESSPVKMTASEIKANPLLNATFGDVDIKRVLPADAYKLKVELKRFERIEERENVFGFIEFNAELISPEGRKIYSERLSRQKSIAGNDIKDLAMALSEQLNELIESTARSIAKKLCDLDIKGVPC